MNDRQKHNAPGGRGQSGGDSAEDIAGTDPTGHTGDRSSQAGRDVGAQTPGDPGDLLSQPLGDGNYRKRGDAQVPLPVTSDGHDDV